MDVCTVGWFTMPTHVVGLFKGAAHGNAARFGARADFQEYSAPEGGTWPAPGDWDQPVLGPGQVLMGVRLCSMLGRSDDAASALEAVTEDAMRYGAAPFVRPKHPW